MDFYFLSSLVCGQRFFSPLIRSAPILSKLNCHPPLMMIVIIEVQVQRTVNRAT